MIFNCFNIYTIYYLIIFHQKQFLKLSELLKSLFISWDCPNFSKGVSYAQETIPGTASSKSSETTGSAVITSATAPPVTTYKAVTTTTEQVHFSTTELPLVTNTTNLRESVLKMIGHLSNNSLLNHDAIEKLNRDLAILDLQIQAVKNGKTETFKKIAEKKFNQITKSIEEFLNKLNEKLNPTTPPNAAATTVQATTPAHAAPTAPPVALR